MKATRSAAYAANAISWVTTIIVIPAAARSFISPNLTDPFRVERGRGFVEEHQPGLHQHRTGDGHPLLLTAGELPGTRALLPSPICSSSSSAPRLARPANARGRGPEPA